MTPDAPHEATAVSTRPGAAGAGLAPRRWAALAVLCMAQFMLTVDDTIVNVALPSIRRDLHFSVADLAWVADAYWLAFGGLLLLGGRLGDHLGRRRLLLGGLVLFTMASLSDGLSSGQAMLVVSRGAQGLGSALVSPAALALIALVFTERGERAKALGIWGGIAGLGGALGVLLGGTITDLLSWRWVFFINVPIGAAVLLVLPRLVGRDRRDERARFDLAGGITVTAGLVALVYAVLGAPQRGWSSPVTLGVLVAAALLLGAFAVLESRRAEPLIPLRFFRERVTRTADITGLLVPSAFAGMFFILTLYLQGVLHYSPLLTGVSYLTLVGALMLAIPLASGRLLHSLGIRPVLAGGLLVMAAGLATFARLPAHGGYWSDVAPGLILVGFGAGWSFIAVTIAAVARARPGETGLASGVINAAQQVGGAIALAVWVSVAAARTTALAAGGASQLTAQVGGYRLAFIVGAGISGFGAIVAAVGLRGLTADEAQKAAHELHA
jgi:EmrB/QacA subfamily drug resistance transporter